MVDIAQEFGGGQASFGGLQDVASKFWREYSDISASPEIVQNTAINGAIDRTRRGQSIDTASAPWQYASGYYRGLGQGGLNVINGTKNVAFSITDLPRQVWNANQWYYVKGAGLVGIGDGGRGAWADDRAEPLVRPGTGTPPGCRSEGSSGWPSPLGFRRRAPRSRARPDPRGER